ncbi:hypothetical protein B0H19DRAFT_1243289 [Mycena capillaripes]|nr:hypothetical protein B0H19DRAFT_1243289 [Mycena capillaripes]
MQFSSLLSDRYRTVKGPDPRLPQIIVNSLNDALRTSLGSDGRLLQNNASFLEDISDQDTSDCEARQHLEKLILGPYSFVRRWFGFFAVGSKNWSRLELRVPIGECADTNATSTSLPTPTQRHLIAQLANILRALGTDTECACSGSSSAVPTVSSLTPRLPRFRYQGRLRRKEKEEQERYGSGRPDDGTEDEERGEGGERECVIRAWEREATVFPPAAVGHGHAWEEVKLIIDERNL